MIPHVFHRIWVGGPMPEEFVRYGIGWRARHPGWVVCEWNESNLPLLDNQEIYDRAEEIAPDNVGQLRADIARYELLYRFGGVYLDCDFECRRSIDELLAGLDAFAAWEADDVWINNAILGSTPRHPFFRRLIDGLASSVQARSGQRPNVMTGPQYLTRLWRWEPPEGASRVFASKLFYPYSWNELGRAGEEFPDAYAVHHWANKRRVGAPR